MEIPRAVIQDRTHIGAAPDLQRAGPEPLIVEVDRPGRTERRRVRRRLEHTRAADVTPRYRCLDRHSWRGWPGRHLDRRRREVAKDRRGRWRANPQDPGTSPFFGVVG